MLKYGWYLEKGTRPHIIRPRRAKVLRFILPGRTLGEDQVVFARYVFHPGIKPMRWISMAKREIGERLRYWLKQLMIQDLKRGV